MPDGCFLVRGFLTRVQFLAFLVDLPPVEFEYAAGCSSKVMDVMFVVVLDTAVKLIRTLQPRLDFELARAFVSGTGLRDLTDELLYLEVDSTVQVFQLVRCWRGFPCYVVTGDTGDIHCVLVVSLCNIVPAPLFSE